MNTCVSGEAPCVDPVCPQAEVHSLYKEIVIYRRLLASAKQALGQAEQIIRDEVEDADMDVGYEPFMNEIQNALDTLARRPLSAGHRILTHMLGMGDDVDVQSRGYRNHYNGVSAKSDVLPVLRDLEARGLVTCNGSTSRGAGFDVEVSYYFSATEAGMDAIGMDDEEKKRAQE